MQRTCEIVAVEDVNMGFVVEYARIDEAAIRCEQNSYAAGFEHAKPFCTGGCSVCEMLDHMLRHQCVHRLISQGQRLGCGARQWNVLNYPPRFDQAVNVDVQTDRVTAAQPPQNRSDPATEVQNVRIVSGNTTQQPRSLHLEFESLSATGEMAGHKVVHVDAPWLEAAGGTFTA